MLEDLIPQKLTPVYWTRPKIIEFFEMTSRLDIYDSFIIRPSEQANDLIVYVNCSDLFYWATADAEPFKPVDIPDLYKAAEDLGDSHNFYAPDLWCCRKRQIRPQGPFYGYLQDWEDPTSKVRREFVPLAVEELFDACGPDRQDKCPRPADGRRWEHAHGRDGEPEDFAANFAPGGRFGP